MAIKSARTETTSGRIVNKRNIFNPNTPPSTVEYLVVAGGGGGGGRNTGGGGGAGGFLSGNKSVTFGLLYTVTVGAGGTGGFAHLQF